MEIRFKDGLPLMVGGAVAGSQECCCENPPPPPPCSCSDYCSYNIEITAPLDVVVRSPVGGCEGGTVFSDGSDSSWLVWKVDPPGGLGLSVGTMTGGDPQSTNWSAQNNVLVAGLAAGVQVVADYTDGDSFDPTITRVEISVGSNMYCEPEPGGNFATRPVAIAGIVVDIKQWRSGQWAPFLGLSACRISKSIAFYPASECWYTNERTCSRGIAGPGPGNFRYVQTPLTIDVSGATTSAGAWGTSTSGSVGSLGSTLLGWAEDIVDAIAATFRITSRPTCQTIGCDCGANLAAGNLIATVGGKEFIIGTASLQSYTATPYIEEYEHFAGGAGTPGNPYQFEWRRYDPTITYQYERQRISLFCDLDETVDPPVNRWYVQYETTCNLWEESPWALIGSTLDVFYGVFPGCYESTLCGALVDPTPIPLGQPEDIARSSGYPVNTLGDGCERTPITPLSFSLRTSCGS